MFCSSRVVSEYRKARWGRANIREGGCRVRELINQIFFHQLSPPWEEWELGGGGVEGPGDEGGF